MYSPKSYFFKLPPLSPPHTPPNPIPHNNYLSHVTTILFRYIFTHDKLNSCCILFISSMKTLLILIAVFSFLRVFSQDTIYFDKDWKKTSKSVAKFYRIHSSEGSKTKIADYYITDTLQMTGFAKGYNLARLDGSFISEGPFVYYHTNGKIRSKGSYKNNIKVGEWLYFYPEGQLHITENYDSKGRFTENFIVYYPDGKVRRSDLYKKGVLQKGNCYIASGNDTTWFPYEIMPEYPGGDEARNRFLAENIIYPFQAMNQGIEGNVYLSFVIDVDGSLVDIVLLQGVSPVIDDEALRVVRLMPKWKPGSQDGKPVRVLFRMPVYFKIQ